jgi:Tfp pilus assembly protein PilO
MLEKLNPREKRIVLFSLTVCGLILLYFLAVEPLSTNWNAVRTQLQSARQKVALLRLDPKSPQTQQHKRLMELVPVLELPKPSDQQGPLLQEAFTNQLRKAGLTSRRMQLVRGRTIRNDPSGYIVLNLTAQGTGRYEQILNLLADLPQNPYCVGVQKCSIKPDPKDRQKLEWEITVFTYATR